MVFGDRLPATAVAMLNGTMCQARDFDPVYEPGVLLPYGPVLAAAFAVGEMTAAGGKDILNAVVLGADLTCRLGKALMTGLGWSRTATLGIFGAALASARLLELTRDQTVSALGLALSQSSGNIQTVIDGSLAKRFQAGFAAEGGVKAAVLASRGITGPMNVFEGRCGFFNLYESGRYCKELVMEGLGTRFEGVNASLKPFPCAREQHGALAAALQLFAQGVRVGNIESVHVRLPPNAYALSGKPFRRSERQSVAGAIGSAAYGVAVALTQGNISLDDFSEEALLRDEIRQVADRIEIVEDRTITDPKSLVPQSVAVKLRDGSERNVLCEAMPGSPGMPLSPDQRRAKLASCVAHAARPCGVGSPDAIVGTIENFETRRSHQRVRSDCAHV